MDLPNHIRLRELELSPHLVKQAEALLSEEEARRRAGFRNVARRDAFAVGRYAARTLLAERLGCAAGAIRLHVLDDGSVDAPGTGLNLSISHSGRYAAAAVADTELGLDLEQVRPRPESLFRFILQPDEMGLRDQVDLPMTEQIVLFWALKESVLKAKRTGLRRSPKSLRLEIDLEARSAWIRGTRNWQARFRLERDRVLAVSWPQE